MIDVDVVHRLGLFLVSDVSDVSWKEVMVWKRDHLRYCVIDSPILRLWKSPGLFVLVGTQVVIGVACAFVMLLPVILCRVFLSGVRSLCYR